MVPFDDLRTPFVVLARLFVKLSARQAAATKTIDGIGTVQLPCAAR
jgi:hypothetical protein